MKHRFILLAITAMTLLMVGCKESSHTTESDSHNNSTENSYQEHKDNLGVRDSLINELILKVDTLTQAQHKAQTAILKLQQLNKNKKAPNLWDVLSLILVFLALIGVFMVGWRTRHDVKRNDVEDIIDWHLEKTGVSNLMERAHPLTYSQCKQSHVSHTANGNIAPLQRNITDLERRITDMERKLSNLQQPQDSVSQITSVVPEKGKSSVPRLLYAKSTSGLFFTETIETKQETCAFVIEWSGTKGKFDIASFGQIKQMNGLENFVHAKGNCTMEDAISYKTIHKGECQKQGNDMWKVVKELEIEILK